MSTRWSLKDLSGPRVRVRDVPRVSSGSPGKFLLKCDPGMIKSAEAALAMAKRHLPMRNAHEVVTRLFDTGEAVVDLPCVESASALVRDLAKCRVATKAYGAPLRVDVKAIRDAFDLSQEQFALEFALELATVRNWEQGRSEPDTAARNFLVTIAHDPNAVRQALVCKDDVSPQHARGRLPRPHSGGTDGLDRLPRSRLHRAAADPHRRRPPPT
jgi:DNA-binding transcriptional regulator YiaG